MYSQELHAYLDTVAEECGVSREQTSLLEDATGCYLTFLAQMLGASTTASLEMLRVSVQLLLLDDGFAQYEADDPKAEAAHYLIGMGYEQTGELIARMALDDSYQSDPLQSDIWYRMTLAMLHYLAGGHRVQALNPLRFIERVGRRLQDQDRDVVSPYWTASDRLRRLYSGTLSPIQSDYRDVLPTSGPRSNDAAANRISQLVRRIRQRRDVMLRDLGRDSEAAWLSERGLTGDDSVAFWARYLAELDRRGITAFTREQVGPGFNEWLRNDADMLVVLPTGSGKSIIGELRTALALASGTQAVWMLPTRALVRQTKRMLREAFRPLGSEVEELPVSEDAVPQFLDAFDSNTSVAVTTPERMAALLRGDREAIASVGVFVLDEAHILLKDMRAETAEMVLRTVSDAAPNARLVLMTAFSQAEEPLRKILELLGRSPIKMISAARPTRRICGVVTKRHDAGNGHPTILIYPPMPYDGTALPPTPYRVELKDIRLRKNAGNTEIGAQLVRRCADTPLRSILFVQRRLSTETQARDISKGQKARDVSPADAARLCLEWGQVPVTQAYAAHGVAPHHGAMARLEQHMVERWLQTGAVSSVVATSTLAEGINLPFDLSILTYTSRYDMVTERQEDLTQEEMLNMLGRAGRAGHVADGVCLIVEGKGPPMGRYYQRCSTFFKPMAATTAHLGVGRLLATALSAGADENDWLSQLSGMSLSQAQALTSSVAQAAVGQDDLLEAIGSHFGRFPTVAAMAPGERERVIEVLVQLALNIRAQTDGDPSLYEVLSTTGLPLPALKVLRDLVLSSQQPGMADVLDWSLAIIKAMFRACADLEWCRELQADFDLDALFAGIAAWMRGKPLRQVLESFAADMAKAKSRHKVVDYLNHDITLLSQFWGALALCSQSSAEADADVLQELRRLPAFMRDGVCSVPQLVWLRETGNVDRVLAHRLAGLGSLFSSYRAQRNYVRSQLRQYRHDPSSMPAALSETERLALQGVLEEVNPR